MAGDEELVATRSLHADVWMVKNFVGQRCWVKGRGEGIHRPRVLASVLACTINHLRPFTLSPFLLHAQNSTGHLECESHAPVHLYLPPAYLPLQSRCTHIRADATHVHTRAHTRTHVQTTLTHWLLNCVWSRFADMPAPGSQQQLKA